VDVRKLKTSPAHQEQTLCPSYLGLADISTGLPHRNAHPSPLNLPLAPCHGSQHRQRHW
jgi:hypothetical protein